MSADINDLAVWIELQAKTLAVASFFWLELPKYGKFNSPKMHAFMYRLFLRECYILVQESYPMARKQQDGMAEGETQQWTFVQVDVTEDEIAAALALYDDANVLWDMAVEVMKEGYKMSITYDEKSDSYCASLTGKNCPKPNVGKTITGWFDDPTSALAMVVYKHVNKLEGIWVSPGNVQKRRG